ncbi:DUF4129 domain-containing protein [Isoptericola croceus]|uniref:DUF4129 domain-containing protein n=1 Tax=Isoptericola croceus TaxID=3031406 RepID=UPI0023F85A12|nr:DUF4129 domain-containing protein [Isoptericola croceus]
MTPRELRTHPAVLLTLTSLVVLGAATTTPWHLTLPAPLLEIALGRPPEPAETPSPPPAPASEPAPRETDDTLLTILLLLALVAALLLLWTAGRKVLAALRDTHADPPEPDTLDTGAELTTAAAPTVPLPELADAVTRALAHLDGAASPGDAVVAAWVALEDAAAEHGTTRHPAQTPTEFTQDVLDATPAPPAHVATLRALYQRARFTTHPTGDDDVATARDALTRIAASLDVSRSRP